MKFRIFNKTTQEMDNNPTLIFENGEFRYLAKQISEYEYEAYMLLTNCIIMKGYQLLMDKIVFDGDILKLQNIKYHTDDLYYIENGKLYDLKYFDNNEESHFLMECVDLDETNLKYVVCGNIHQNLNKFKGLI